MSPRNKKPRTCGCRLAGKAFKPSGLPMTELERITLFEDELEALKLCDLDGLTQEEAGASMGISRGTVQRLLAGARKKTAEALSQGKALVFAKINNEEDVNESMFPS